MNKWTYFIIGLAAGSVLTFALYHRWFNQWRRDRVLELRAYSLRRNGKRAYAS